MPVAANYASGHNCHAFADFERERFVYTDPYFNFADGHRD